MGFIAVGVGASLGAWLRWILGVALNAAIPHVPLGTLIANLVGGYLIGVAIEFLGMRTSLPPEIRLLIVTGFLGGLTTFSTFSAEAMTLMSRGTYGWAALHIGAHLVGSIALTFAGIATVRALS